MASLNKMSEARLRSLHKEQKQAINNHIKVAFASSNRMQHAAALRRLEARLDEIEQALSKFQ